MRKTVLLFLMASFSTGAVVIRDDVPDLKYRMAAGGFPALADLPGEGHGVLIADQWVVTAAHAVGEPQSLDVVVVGCVPRAVSRVVIHPGYKRAPREMVDTALKSGDWEPFFDFMATTDDIALIKLSEPVRDVEPVRIHGNPAVGQVIRIMGRGATGTGLKGHLHSPNRTDLRQGYNAITLSEGRWIGYVFDAPPHALPLEAITGSGDSGGPILLNVDNEWRLAGVAAWKRAQVKGTEIHAGRYGEASYGVRLGYYADWIAMTTRDEAD